MPKTQHTSPYAVAYAQSLLELANESNRAEPIAQELRAIREIVTGSETFRMYLADPGIGEQERGETMKRIFGSQASELVLHFLGVLNAHRRLGGLVEIADAYDDLLDQQLGKIEVDVTVAQKLSPEQLAGHRAAQPVNAGDAVADFDDRADFRHLQLLLEAGDLALQDAGDFCNVDGHFVSVSSFVFSLNLG